MLTEDDRPTPMPDGHVYKPAELRIADLHLHQIHIRRTDEGRMQAYVMANYNTQREVVLWEDSNGVKMGKWWCFLADAVCRWLNLPAEEREAERKARPRGARFRTPSDLVNASGR